MSKRKLSKQQSNRVKAKQASYLLDETGNLPADVAEGLVVSRFGKWAEVETQDKQNLICAIRANIHSVVAGDRVLWQRVTDEQGAIVHVLERTSVLSRPNLRGEEKTVAANISLLVIVIAPKPEITWHLLDSYLVVAELLDIQPLIVLNKCDLPHESMLLTLHQVYKPLGYDILLTSTNQNQGLDVLTQRLKEEISVLVGQSGVGKSSLTSALIPKETSIVSKKLSEISELGQHTTSSSRYYHLPQGGGIIDSPGVREFALWHIDAHQLISAYKELYPLTKLCKFRDCNHINAPGCAILQAIADQSISTLRYENFRKLLSKRM